MAVRIKNKSAARVKSTIPKETNLYGRKKTTKKQLFEELREASVVATAISSKLIQEEKKVCKLSADLSKAHKRNEQLEGHILDMRSYIEDLWAQVDMLRRMVAGSETVAAGLTAREVVRQSFKHESMAILPNTPENTDENEV